MRPAVRMSSASSNSSCRFEGCELVNSREPSAWLVDEAKKFPNGWVYEIVGEFGVTDAVPREAIKGAWPVGPDGVITGEFLPNPNFRPSAHK